MNTVAFNYEYPQPPLAKEEAILGVWQDSGIGACRAPLIKGSCLPVSLGTPAPCQKRQPGDSSQGKQQEGKEMAQMLPPLSRSVGPQQRCPQPNARGEALAGSEFQKPSPPDLTFSCFFELMTAGVRAGFSPQPLPFPTGLPSIFPTDEATF